MNAYRLPHVADEPDLREVEFPFRQISHYAVGCGSREAAHLLIAAAGNRATTRTTAAISVILL
jgi:hypothetical protein